MLRKPMQTLLRCHSIMDKPRASSAALINVNPWRDPSEINQADALASANQAR
ncbi:hypothetical protein ISN76_06555 [Dyella halodurans]|uniref:Uncharacterized protein n=1 Tax=Dyella halodurans TaxID=1920171 RepID=A0ABV9C4I9_9GAMM|nr:hypothetical protein [Dyella halodurans]